MSSISRDRVVRFNRTIALVSVSAAFISYLYQPTTVIAWAIDIVFRAYAHFVAAVMAHESVHGHLGNTRRTNDWWGRFSLLPTTVPYVTFRKTHLHHHSSTNEPEKDPDEFLNTPHTWQIPFRTFALPYHWVFWMWRNHRFPHRDRIEYGLNYAVVALVYGALMTVAGWERVMIGFLFSAGIHSLLLWYWFAIKTHEGYSTGAAETRSHDYDSVFLYWFSLGLSMHRVHHMKPQLAWLQMARVGRHEPARVRIGSSYSHRGM